MPRSGPQRSRERRQGTRIGVLRTFADRSCAFAAPFAGADTMLLRTFSKRTTDIVRFAACRREKRAMAEPLEKSLGKTASARHTRKKSCQGSSPALFYRFSFSAPGDGRELICRTGTVSRTGSAGGATPPTGPCGYGHLKTSAF